MTNRFFSGNKEVRKKVRKLVQEGWRVEMGGSHFRLISPKGISLSLTSTPSNWAASNALNRDINNIVAGKIQLVKRSHTLVE